MRRMHIAMLGVLFGILLAQGVEARSFGEMLFGSDPKLNQPPFNRLEMSLFYRDSLHRVDFGEPVIYQLQEAGGQISSILPDTSMPVPICERPVGGIFAGTIMSGKGINKLFAAYGAPIKFIICPSNGWEAGNSWLYYAIKQARRSANLEGKMPDLDQRRLADLEELERYRRRDPNAWVDPGPFPPFIVLPQEIKPRLNPDGSISFAKGTLSIPLAIVVPVSNQLLTVANSVSVMVTAGKNSYAGCIVGFKTTPVSTFKVPNPAANTDHAAHSTVPDRSEQNFNSDPACLPNLIGLLRSVGAPPGCPWDRESKYIEERLTSGGAGLITYMILKDGGGSLMEGGIRFWFNGELFEPEAPYIRVGPPGSTNLAVNREICFMVRNVPANALVKAEYSIIQGRKLVRVVDTHVFRLGPAGTVTVHPAFEGVPQEGGEQ